MPSSKQTYEITKEEFTALKEELVVLKTVRREEVSEKIRVARGFGDLSENSEYDEAKNDQAHLESKISRLEEQLKNVTVIETVTTDCVAVGTKVILLDVDYNEEAEYRIIGSVGTGSGENNITSNSPVGMAIMGKREGEEAIVLAPAGEIKFKIIKIDK